MTQRLDEIAEKLERRRNIYLAKRDKFDALAEDTETVWERYDFAAEVIEWMADDLGVALPERPDDPALRLKETNDGRE